jgi:ribA/ribD-fused uncharacterized protein
MFYKVNEPYGFMSSFYKAKMFIYNKWWASVEHAYQAQKCLYPEEALAIWKTVKCKDARDLGQKVSLRPDWDKIQDHFLMLSVKDQVMLDCVLAKFVQHHDLRKMLLDTGAEELIEDTAPSNDMYWGCGKDGTGKNMLGKILMKVRSDLMEQ